MNQSELINIPKLVESRTRRAKAIGGEYFIIWGSLLIINLLIQIFTISNIWMWVAFVAIGLSCQYLYAHFVEYRKGRCDLAFQKQIEKIWLITILIVLPTIVFILPGVFKLYGGQAVWPLVFLVISITQLTTSILGKSWPFLMGAGVFFSSIFLVTLAKTEIQYHTIVCMVIFCGLILPGVLSKIIEKRTK